MEYYTAQIGLKPIDDEKIEQRREYSKLDDMFAKRETNFIVKLWNGDAVGAIQEFEENIEAMKLSNPRLAGWYALWVGAAYNTIGNENAMYDWYDEARNRLGGKLPLPRRHSAEVGEVQPEKTVIEEGLRRFCVGTLPDIMKSAMRARDAAAPAFADVDHKIAEEAIRQIGANLGFDSRRPCTDENDGPDNLWLDSHAKVAIPIELKTDKKKPLNSEEIGQVFQHLEWVRSNYSDYAAPGIIVYSEVSEVTQSSNPSSEMFFSDRASMSSLWNEFLEHVKHAAKLTPVERYLLAAEIGQRDEWSVDAIFRRLTVATLKSTS